MELTIPGSLLLIFGGSLFYELVWISAHYIILEGMNRSRLASCRSRNLQLIAVKYTKACEECPLGTSRGMPPPPPRNFLDFRHSEIVSGVVLG